MGRRAVTSAGKPTIWVLLPVYAGYLVLFGLSAESKFAGGGVPEWFRRQFSGSPLDFGPASLAMQYYGIATVEALLTLGLLVSLVLREFRPGHRKPVLQLTLLVACFLFVGLGFGLRLTGDYNTAFQAFGYLAVTWALLRWLELRES